MILEKKKKELKEERERMEGEAVSVLCQTVLWDFWGRILRHFLAQPGISQ